MKSKPESGQVDIFSIPIERIIDPGHPLCKLANEIDWNSLDGHFGKFYSPDNGRPAKPTRLMIGLQYLKFTFDLSDEVLIDRWVENPYWQYFCGQKTFTHRPPIDPSLMTRWRDRIKSEGMEKLLEETIRAGLKLKVISKRSFKHLNVDTTVQEKAITYPTDAKLCHRMRERLVKLAKESGIELRQSYKRKSKWALIMQSRYSHARQMKRSKKEIKKVKNYLGRVIRDIERKTRGNERLANIFSESLEMSNRLFNQKRNDKNKIYSLWAPEAECIAKGKAHKKYEFGCKVGLVSTSKDNFIVGIQAFHGSPYDGHTLTKSIEQAERLTGLEARDIFVDRGYRGHKYDGSGKVHVVGSSRKKLTRSLRKWFKRRSAIEPLIGHVKNDGRMDRNYLKGVEGDRINAILSGCGYNLRKILRDLLFWLIAKWRFFERMHKTMQTVVQT